MKKQMKLFTLLMKPFVLFVLLFALGVGESWADMYLAGTMNSWAQTDATKFVDNKIEVTLDAETTYTFKIVDGDKWRSCDASITNTTLNYVLDKENVDGHNISITTGEAGTYIFQYSWYDDKHHFSVYYPQSRLKKNTVLYFDGRNSTKGWGTYTWGARFFYKYYDSGGDHSNLDCTSAVEDYVHYTTVPNHDYLGQIQVERKDPNNMGGTRWNYAAVCCAYNRANSGQNCMAISDDNKGWDDNFTPIWTTYCPPISSVTMTDNGSTLYGGNGSAGTPYLIEAGDPIRVHVTEAVSAVDDGNMIANYQFKDGASNIGDEGIGTSASKTSGSSGTTHTIIVEARNKYNGAAGTLARCTLYYETKTVYTGLSVAKSGDDSKASAPTISQTWAIATNSVTVTATVPDGYRFTGWTSSNGSFGDATALSTTFTPTADNAVATATYALRWAIATSYNSWNTNDHIIGNISTSAGVTSGYVDITLPANTDYELKVFDKTNHWLGHTTSGVTLTYSNSGTKYAMAEGNYNLGFTTAGAGSYRFTWDITNSKVSVTYPTSYYVTAAGNPAAGGTVTPSSATYMSTSVGGEITATPNYSHYFNGWTSSAGGTFTNASAATTTFKPASAAATVTAAFAERTAFIEGNFQIYNSSRATRTKTGDSWQDASTAIKMTYDAGNNRYYLHTYSTPTELRDQLNDAGAFFYVKTSTSSSSIADAATYKACNSAAQSLSEYGSSHSLLVTTGESEHGFKFTGSEDGYVIIYFNGTHVWYELECALSYYGGEGATGDAPAERTYYAYNSNQTAASNSYSKTGYTFDHWDTAADDSGSDYAAGATNVAMNAHEVCLHAMWTINNHDITYTAPSHGSYTIKAGDASAVSENISNVDYNTTVTLAATPASGYSFSSWSLTGATAADASSANTTFSMPDNDVTVAASFTEDKHTVTVEVGSAGGGVFSYGGSSSLTTKEISGIGISTATGDIVVDSLNPAWRFKKWEYDGAKITITTGGYTSKTIRVNATADATITAVFEPRFGLIGSLNEDGDPAGGMPNKDGETWGIVRSEDYEADFEVISFTAVGTGEGTGVDLRCTRTLESNKQYKFQIVDRATVGRDRFCLAADGSALLEANESITLNYKEQSNANVLINTIGYGEYTFRITNIAATTYNPTVTVDRPTDSKQLTLKCGYSIDAASSVTLSNDGGTAMGHTDEGGDGFDISDGGFFKSGSHITFTATPATGYVFEGWYTDNTYGTRFATDNPMTMTEGTNANVTVYARFIEKTNTFTDGASTGMWNNTSNWSLGSLPTINERVVITKPVTVDIAYATAKRIILNQNDNTGKLTVQANKGLEVAETITRTTDGSNSLATREEDLILESSSSEGNASLIFNNSNSNAATVQMYSKADIDGDTWNWQYVGTPFTGSIPQYNYYGSWMYKWNGGKWDVVTGSETLDPFAGYCLTQESATTHVMGGTLVSTTDDVEVTMAAKTDMVLANSWTAPIWIGGFTEETFKSKPATIYLFNTGSAESGSTAGKEAGTYEAVPVNSGPYFGTELIPSMQGFFVTTNGVGGSAGSITLKYDELVRSNEYRRTGSVAPITSGPMYAPKRETKPEVMKIKTLGAKYSDRVVILERADFSQGFDNGWDGEKLSFGAEAPSVYVINEQGGYDAVSAIPGFEGTLVGFRAGTNNSCTMTFEYDGEEIWYLNDLQTQQSTLIDSELTYTFSTSNYDNEARFIISATPIRKITTGNESVGAEAAKVRKLIINDKLYIIRGGRMYSADGAMIK